MVSKDSFAMSRMLLKSPEVAEMKTRGGGVIMVGRTQEKCRDRVTMFRE